MNAGGNFLIQDGLAIAVHHGPKVRSLNSLSCSDAQRGYLKATECDRLQHRSTAFRTDKNSFECSGQTERPSFASVSLDAILPSLPVDVLTSYILGILGGP